MPGHMHPSIIIIIIVVVLVLVLPTLLIIITFMILSSSVSTATATPDILDQSPWQDVHCKLCNRIIIQMHPLSPSCLLALCQMVI